MYSPLVTSLMVSDEMERPDVIKVGNKYYLFSATRLSRGTKGRITQLANKIVGDNVAMIGFVSDHLTHGYVPLNSSGVVLTASVPSNWRTATYSYYAVPIEGKEDQLLITAYMTNRGEVAGKGNNATWAPSFLLQLNPDNTTTVLAKLTNQGVWVWNDNSENKNMMGTINRNAKNSAGLYEEWGKVVDWNAIDKHNLRTQKSANSNPDSSSSAVPEVATVSDDQIKGSIRKNAQLNATQNTQSKLPKAGTKNGVAAVILGAVSSMLGAIGLAGISKRERKD